MKIDKMLPLAIIANISLFGALVCIGEAIAETGDRQTIVIEVNLGPQESALVLQIQGDTIEPFEVSCRDDGQESDRVRNDDIQTCHGSVPVGLDLSISLRIGGGEMTAIVGESGDETAGAFRYFEWNESGLNQTDAPEDNERAVEATPEEQPQSQRQSRPNNSPVLPLLFGGVAALGFATVLVRASRSGGVAAGASLIGLPPDIEIIGGRDKLDSTIDELLGVGPLVVAHPESLEITPREKANIISVTERDVVDLIDVLGRLAAVNPSQRIAVIVVGQLEIIGDPGVSFVERLEQEAPVGSLIRVLK